MEYEVRYYFPTEKLENIIQKLKKISGLTMESRCYEKTAQFDHPNKEMSFYSKEVDGRFRIRVSKNENYSYLLGYSEIKNNSSEEMTEKFTIFPTRISNIKKLTLGKRYEIKEDAIIKEENLYLVKKSIQRKANEMIKNKIVSYGYSGEIKLALTKRGKELLEIILHNRPFRLDKAKIEEGGAKVEKIETLNEEKYIYTFNSTYFAVKTYFLSFGKDCTILGPQKLKEEFKEEYIKALKNYE